MIVELEQEAQFKALYMALEATGLKENEIEEKIRTIDEREDRDDVYEDLSFCGPKRFISHIRVPSTQEIQEEILKRKKEELLKKLLSGMNEPAEEDE